MRYNVSFVSCRERQQTRGQAIEARLEAGCGRLWVEGEDNSALNASSGRTLSPVFVVWVVDG